MERKYRIGVSCADPYLFQKIKLSLSGVADVISDGAVGGCDITVTDTVTENGRGVRVSYGDTEEVLGIPFDIDVMREVIDRCASPLPIRLDPEARRAYVMGEEIKLTEIETVILKILIERNGEYVSRDELLDTVWGSDAECGVVNVYIHYLRSKLEKAGEKIILSSRKCGYKLSEKYSRTHIM